MVRLISYSLTFKYQSSAAVLLLICKVLGFLVLICAKYFRILLSFCCYHCFVFFVCLCLFLIFVFRPVFFWQILMIHRTGKCRGPKMYTITSNEDYGLGSLRFDLCWVYWFMPIFGLVWIEFLDLCHVFSWYYWKLSW